jgi:NAD(P)-dependent dehydrogenase (short-subunit alcohol dehydrogenase family)
MNAPQGRVAAVTGAGSGVGRHSALALLGDGYIVALLGRRVAALEETASMAGARERCLVIPTDVTEEEAVRNAFDLIKGRAGRLDVLFNNAGGGAPPVPLEDLSLEQWQGVVDVNLTGMFLCTREAVRIMKGQQPRGGRIINNASVSAQTPRPNSAPYTSTKHAVTGFTKSVALDGRPFDICCGQIDIGNAETPMTAKMAQGVLQADLTIAPEPTIDADHVARAILYMANLPLDANVLTMTVMATQMPLVGRG